MSLPLGGEGEGVGGGELERLRRQLEEMTTRAEEAEREREEAKREREEEKRAREEEKRAREDAERAREKAEKDFDPLGFPVALARVHSIKDCSSTTTKPHVHDYADPPTTTLAADFGLADLADVWREEDDGGQRLVSTFNVATRFGTLSTRNEASLATYVGQILHDCVKALGLLSWVAINPEVTSLQIRADFWVIYDPDNRPIGTVEVKQHGPLTDKSGKKHDSAVDHPGVLAQVHEQLSHLRHVWGVKQAFGIVTTLRAWRVCWLDDDVTNTLARRSNNELLLLTRECAGEVLATPQKPRGAADGAPRASPPRTPVAVPRTLEDVIVLGGDGPTEADDASLEIKPPVRAALAMSRAVKVCEPRGEGINNEDLECPEVMNLVGAALLRMYASETLFNLEEPFKNADERNFTIVEPEKTSWGKLRLEEGCPAMGRFPRDNTARLWLVGRVGKGRDGIAHLACTAGARAVCVIKERRARTGPSLPSADDAKVQLEKEQMYWTRVYGTGFRTRVAKWNGVWTLMTPFFSHIAPELRRDARVMAAIEKVLGRFVDAGVRHNDVAWRNVCLYKTQEGELRAVLIDFADVGNFPEGQHREEWVQEALESLEASA